MILSEDYRLYREAVRAGLRQDVDCPDPDCDEGWVATSGCGGHLCGWAGHYEETE